MSARAVVLQHQDDSPPALLADWASTRATDLTVVRVDEGAQLPAAEPFDFGVVLGSDESVDGPGPGWIEGELRWLQEADAVGLPLLGICFGAQALAGALGGGVRRLRRPELGWVWLEAGDTGLGDGPWFTWHEDTIVLPPGATELISNECGTQAYAIGSHLGVQFHPEVSREEMKAWCSDASGREELERAGVDPERLGHEADEFAGQSRHGAFRLFDIFAAQARAARETQTPTGGRR